MSRHFDASGQSIDCSIGTCGPSATGAYTLLSLVKLPLFAGASGLVAVRRLGAYARYNLISGNKAFGFNDFSAGFGTMPEDVWFWIAQRKLAGSQLYEFAFALYPVVNPNTDITFGSNLGTHADFATDGDLIRLGSSDVVGRGDHALHALWNGYLTDAQIKTALTTNLSDIMALGPAGCWPLNQANASDPVLDVTNHGANQTALVGTQTTLAADPPGYNFALSVAVTGSAHFDLGAMTLDAEGVRTTHGTATINLGALTLAASSITGGPAVADDFYSAGPCRPYEYTSMCTIPLEAAAITGAALQAASEIVYYASAQRFDDCQVTLRPCRKTCSEGYWPYNPAGWWEWGSGLPRPALIAGQWFNIICGACGDTCSCTMISEVILPGPVREIVQVTVDGVILTPDVDYRLDDYRKLVRLGDVWPFCNDLNKGITQSGTWSVTAVYGLPLPALGKIAVGELFCEIISDILGGECGLPPNLTELTRQGVTMTFETVQEAMQAGFVGLKYVDRFIATYNPNHLVARPRVYDLDSPDSRVTGTSII